MKICFIFLFVFSFQLLALDTKAQEAVIELKTKSTTVGQLINEIEKQTDYLVVYSNREIDVARKVDVQRKSDKVSSYLNEAFAGTDIGYDFENNYIVLMKKANRNAATVAEMIRSAQQQGKTITGKVVDANGEPIIGATILIKGTGQGTVTDMDGNYALRNVPEDAILQFSYVGMETQEIPVRGKTIINVAMKEAAELLEEVVVVGYGTQKKVNLTGSVGIVNVSESLESRPVTNIHELLAGAVPGLLVTKSSGAVGSGAQINIRGVSTIGGSSGVLILIDGAPGNISTLNPNDIESISVLKDAASAAIYGARAANGVILITTKQPFQVSRPIVEISSSVGIQNPQHSLDFVGAEDFMKLYDQAMINDGKEAIYGQKGLDDLKNGLYPDNKWYKEIYRKNTFINNNYLAFSGSEKSINYHISVSNDNQQGSLPRNEYARLAIKPNLTLKLANNLELQANLQYTQTKIEEPQGGTTLAQSQAARISPITRIKEDNGLYAVGSAHVGNPIAGVHEGGFVKNKYKELFSIFDLRYSPIKDLNIRGNVFYYTFDQRQLNRSFTYYLYDSAGDVAKTVNAINFAKNDDNANYTLQMQLVSDYSIATEKGHNVKVLGGYSQEYKRSDGFWASRDEMPFNNVHVISTGGSNIQNGGSASHVAIQSLFGRINYDYNNRYLFEANIRADGSSRFAKGHRWGVFPSFSAGWNIQSEEFMKDFDWISQLKLRVSWGELGDSEKSQIGFHPTATVLNYDPKIYTFAGKLVSGAYNNRAINPKLSWETAQMSNIGLDIGFFRQRVNISIEYFINTRNDILYSPPVPTEFGLNAPYNNLLKMRNKGCEFLIGYNDKKNDITWGADVNFGFSQNKVLEMGDNSVWIEGNTITSLNDRYQLPYGYEAVGLFQSEDEIKNSATQGAAKPGNIKFKDQNNDGKIDGGDRIVLNRRVPVDYGGNIRFGYRNIDFSANFYGRINTMNYLSGYEGWAFYLSENARPMHLDSWTPENPNASYPRLTLVYTSNDTQYNSFWLRKSSYFKLQNIQFGYILPEKILNSIGIKFLRLYLSGQNIATISGYDGFDPEGGWYPLHRTFSIGFNIKF